MASVLPHVHKSAFSSLSRLVERYALLRRDRLQERQDSLLFHRFNDNEGMGGPDQGAEIMHAGRESHRREMLARGSGLTKKTDNCS